MKDKNEERRTEIILKHAAIGHYSLELSCFNVYAVNMPTTNLINSIEELKEKMDTLYAEYVNCPSSELTPDAKKLRRKLKRFWIPKKQKKGKQNGKDKDI